eukprot:39021_1
MDINDPPSIQIPQQRLAGFHPQIPAIDDGELIQNDPVIQQALSREEENQNHDQLMEINQNIQMDLSQITDLLPRAQTMMKNRRRNKRKRRREAMEASDNTVVHVDQREEQTHEHKRRKISQMRRRNDSEDQVNRIIIRKALTPRIFGAIDDELKAIELIKTSLETSATHLEHLIEEKEERKENEIWNVEQMSMKDPLAILTIKLDDLRDALYETSEKKMHVARCIIIWRFLRRTYQWHDSLQKAADLWKKWNRINHRTTQNYLSNFGKLIEKRLNQTEQITTNLKAHEAVMVQIREQRRKLQIKDKKLMRKTRRKRRRSKGSEQKQDQSNRRRGIGRMDERMDERQGTHPNRRSLKYTQLTVTRERNERMKETKKRWRRIKISRERKETAKERRKERKQWRKKIKKRTPFIRIIERDDFSKQYWFSEQYRSRSPNSTCGLLYMRGHFDYIDMGEHVTEQKDIEIPSFGSKWRDLVLFDRNNDIFNRMRNPRNPF